MMMVTVVDVTGRYVFNAPLRAGFELTEYLMGVLVFLALPLVSARGEHVRISLLDSRFGEKARALRDRLVGLCTGLVCLLIAWPLAMLALRMASYGDGTQTLGIALAPLAFFMVASLVLSGVVMAIAPFMKR
jgi:TRAP-type C4-dicarboxylate transport system permease small subunit